jgi:hypothetical protein
MKKVKLFIGVDVGKKGGVFVMDETRNVLDKFAIPLLKGSTDVDEKELFTRLENVKVLFPDYEINVVIEDVHSLYGMSAKSNFSFGRIKGLKEAFMMALNYDYKLVPPKNWQKQVWMAEDMIYVNPKKKDTKATSLNAATRIFPEVDFRSSERAKIPHDGIVDAALMAEYARMNMDND